MADKTKTDLAPQEPRVFVYGTLKSGKSNFRALREATFLGYHKLFGPYVLLDMGWYPGLVEIPGMDKELFSSVYGEVYRINDDILHTLDLIEGHPHYYNRKKIETPWKKAWAYFLPPEYVNQRQRIEAGVWNPSPREKEVIATYEASTEGDANAVPF